MTVRDKKLREKQATVEDLTEERKALAEDASVQSFVRYLQQEKQASRHTVSNYLLDIAQFLKLQPRLRQKEGLA